MQVKKAYGNQYQWRRNGTNIVGATESSYVISSVSTTNVGFYTCVVKIASKFPVETITCPVALYAFTSSSTTTSLVTSVSGPLSPVTGSVGDCPGAYQGYAKFKTSTGSY